MGVCFSKKKKKTTKAALQAAQLASTSAQPAAASTTAETPPTTSEQPQTMAVYKPAASTSDAHLMRNPRKLYFNLRKVKCVKQRDHLVLGKSEFYWTWQGYTTRKKRGDHDVSYAWQGHSQRVELEDGYSFGTGDERVLEDPWFVLDLADLETGETDTLTLDVTCWESDDKHDTVMIKKAYSNEGLSNALQAKLAGDSDVFDEVKGLLDVVPTSALALMGPGGVTSATALELSKSGVDVVKGVMSIVRKFSKDDFVSEYRVKIEYHRKEDGTYVYRMFAPSGPTQSMSDDEMANLACMNVQFRDSTGKNQLDCEVELKIMKPLQ